MLKWARCGQTQASQAGLLAFCARLCSTEAGHELCSTVVTPRPHQPWQLADLVERARCDRALHRDRSAVHMEEARAVQLRQRTAPFLVSAFFAAVP